MVMMDLETEALIARANEEREKIFLKYERGRDPGAEIDPWEDPDFVVYLHTDRYGFIHEKKLPSDHESNQYKRKAIELEREKKWLKMLRNWDKPEIKEKLRKRVFKGIPNKLRSSVWPKLLNVEKTMKANEGVYQKMLKLARRYTTEARQVDADVNRQFREHISYRERFSVKQKSLFNVLTAYSMYNMEVGYCQGMAGVAGILLMYMDEEEAFWGLNTLFIDEKYSMHGLFIEGFPKLTRFLQHHDHLLRRFLPRLKKHFDKHNIDAILYSLKWFFVIFVERIPFSLALRIWDLYLLLGERVMSGMAFTILKLHKNRLMRLRDMDLIIEFLQVKLYQEFGFEDDHVIRALEQMLVDLKRVKMDLPPSAGNNEKPKKPLGQFIEPSLDSLIGHRKSTFTENELKVHDEVLMRQHLNEVENNSESRGSDDGNEDDNFADDMTEENPERSLVETFDTSVTSTVDISVFSGGGYTIDDSHSLVGSIPEEDEEMEQINEIAQIHLTLENDSKKRITIPIVTVTKPPEDLPNGQIPHQLESSELSELETPDPTVLN